MTAIFCQLLSLVEQAHTCKVHVGLAGAHCTSRKIGQGVSCSMRGRTAALPLSIKEPFQYKTTSMAATHGAAATTCHAIVPRAYHSGCPAAPCCCCCCCCCCRCMAAPLRMGDWNSCCPPICPPAMPMPPCKAAASIGCLLVKVWTLRSARPGKVLGYRGQQYPLRHKTRSARRAAQGATLAYYLH